MQVLTVGEEERLFFVSDLHLCESRPHTTRAFLDFLEAIAPQADRLFILGDLFEYWIGDDDDRPLARTIAAALANLPADTRFMAGNRDFLLGEDYATLAGMRLLAEPAVLSVGGRRLLLLHGDTLCTDDLAYQAFRRQVRDPAWQRAFLRQPLGERRAFAARARAQSRQATAAKQEAIMDVNPGAVEAAFSDAQADVLIHGHTHRPASHAHRIGGHERRRHVLADWDGHARYLDWRHGQATARAAAAPDA